MTFLKRFKAQIRNIKYRWRRATEKAQDEAWIRSYARQIMPDRLEVYDTHLVIDEQTFVRCLVCGLPDRKGGEGYPRDLTSKSIERVQEISFDACKIMLSHSVIQIDGGKAREKLRPIMTDLDNLAKSAVSASYEKKLLVNQIIRYCV